MKRVHLLTGSRREDGERKLHYILEIQEAPAWKILRGKLYHWWDMHSCKWWWMKKIVGPLSEVLHNKSWHLGGTGYRRNSKTGEMEPFETEPLDEKIPWDIRQDLRCFEWNNHPTIFETEISKEQYASLGGRVEDSQVGRTSQPDESRASRTN